MLTPLTATVPEPPRQWTCFARASWPGWIEQRLSAAAEVPGALTRYTFEYSKVYRGDALLEFKPGEQLERRRTLHPAQPASGTGVEVQFLAGVTQHLHYTSQAQRARLLAVSAAEFAPSPHTRAVVIPIRKSNAWWNLAQDARAEFFMRRADSEGHTAIGEVFAAKIYRQLLHSRYMESAAKRYDFVTYFEFLEEDTADFLELLRHLRDESLNPEWHFVNLEQELWLRKQ